VRSDGGSSAILPDRVASATRRWAACAAVVSLTGCSNTLYAVRVTQASAELARAEQLDAAVKAPYEYHYALEHLRKARTEAAEADYGDAALLAETAYHYAGRAIQLAQRVQPALTPGNGDSR
jgi:predicted aminopeptidase